MKKHFSNRSDAPTDSVNPVLSRITQGYLWTLFTLFPLLPCIGGYQAVSQRAFFFFLILSIGYLSITVIVGLELILVGKARAGQILAPLLARRATRFFLLFYIGWSILSALFSPVGGTWIGLGRQEGLSTILLYGLLFFAVSSYGKWDNRYLYPLGAVTILNAVIGLLQYAGLNPLYLYPAGTNFHDAFVLYNGAFLGTIGNIDILSAFLCLVIPLFYSAFLLTGKKLALLPMGAGTLLLTLADVDSGFLGLVAALVLTAPLFFCRCLVWRRGCIAFGVLSGAIGIGKLLDASRETSLSMHLSPLSIGLLGCAFVLLAAGFLLRRQRLDATPSFRLAKGLGICVLLLICASIGAAYAIPFAGGAAHELHQILHGNFDPSFGSGRIRIWQEVLGLIREAPLFGGGPDTLLARMPFTFTRESAELGITIETAIDTAHNDFLNIAVNQGLPALGFYLAMLITWLFRCLKHWRQPGVLLLLPGILAYLAQSFFTFSICSVSVLFWVFLALSEQTAFDQKEEPTK